MIINDFCETGSYRLRELLINGGQMLIFRLPYSYKKNLSSVVSRFNKRYDVEITIQFDPICDDEAKLTLESGQETNFPETADIARMCPTRRTLHLLKVNESCVLPRAPSRRGDCGICPEPIGYTSAMRRELDLGKRFKEDRSSMLAITVHRIK